MAQSWESVRSSPISAAISWPSVAEMGPGSSSFSMSGTSVAVRGAGSSVEFPGITGASSAGLGLWKVTSKIHHNLVRTRLLGSKT